jgi:hypothetical protein
MSLVWFIVLVCNRHRCARYLHVGHPACFLDAGVVEVTDQAAGSDQDAEMRGEYLVRKPDRAAGDGCTWLAHLTHLSCAAVGGDGLFKDC